MAVYQTPVNTPTMSGYEARIRRAVEAGEIVTYRVAPVYRGSDPMPVAITIEATGDDGFALSLSIPNRP